MLTMVLYGGAFPRLFNPPAERGGPPRCENLTERHMRANLEAEELSDAVKE